MKKKLIITLIEIGIITNLTLHADSQKVPFPIPNSMVYPSNQESDSLIEKELFTENSFSEKTSGNKDVIDIFDQMKENGIRFLRKEDKNDPDSSGIVGYYWDLKNNDDKLQYGGVARVEQDRYVSVIAVEASRVSDENLTGVATDTPKDLQRHNNGKFNPGYLIYFGTFIGEQDGKTYYLYGRYVNTLLPIDPLDANGKYPIENA